jgi:DNA helicase-2/ATP-dependent DNA helicase PcrA
MSDRYTDEQRRSIEHLGSHSITHACAGSGKTAMLVGRVRFLLEQGIPAERIRVLAFNVAAVEEFRGRLEGSLPRGWALPKVNTFNSIGNQLLHRFAAEGWLPRLRLETNGYEEKKLVRLAAQAALKEQCIEAVPGQDELEALRMFVGLVKSDVVSAEEAFATFRQPPHLNYFVRAFALFEESRLRAGVRFYADQIAEPVALMRRNAAALGMVTNRLDYVICDEWQDASRVQVELVSQIVGTRATLCVVGDGDQSIYGWRGSRPGIMASEFDQFFPGATRFALTRTFRFGHQLSLAANLLIRHNRERAHNSICVSSPGNPDTRIHAIRASTTGSQSSLLAVLDEWRRSGRALRECAVLARLWAHVLGLELSLLAANVPYYKPGGDVFSVVEISGLLGYLRLAAGTLFDDPNARETVRNMLSTPTLWLPTPALERTTTAIMDAPEKAPAILAGLVTPNTKAFMAERILARASAWRDAVTMAEIPAADALRLYAQRTDMIAHFTSSATTDGASEKTLAYETLLDWALSTGDRVVEFVARMDRLARTRERYEAGGDAVLLTTIHQTKGLEYPLVVVLGLEQGQFPSRRGDPEEERRLAYVAITRAREELYLMIPPDEAFDAKLTGRKAPVIGRSRHEASRFAYEVDLRTSINVGQAITRILGGDQASAALPTVPADAANMVNRYLAETGVAARVPEAAQAATASSEIRWAVADRLRHRVFGEGVVVGFIDKDILDVDFAGQRRSLKVGVAPLERLAAAST